MKKKIWFIKLEESFDKFSSKEKTIIYEEKIYDSYSILIDIFNEANNEIIIIDNYSNKELFDILKFVYLLTVYNIKYNKIKV